ncbi:MAG TPA: methyltransferase domain-containing protein [Actinomycetota bacterium]|nr:methyltransferase domain-containing protein [Actinomycetota bacterium]
MSIDDAHRRLQQFWDADSRTYDATSSHSVADPVEAATWRALMARVLPEAPARILDVGAGTGAMSLLAASLGHRVTALDLSTGMLERLRAKAADRGYEIEIVEAPADRPPAGPFDVVMERHVLWTLPDPPKALAALRAVTPGGRLVSFEGMWGQSGLAHQARRRAGKLVRQALRVPGDHHRHYEPELLAQIPLASGTTAAGLLEAIEAAGWRNARLERMRDVEWARSLQERPVLRPFEGVPLFVIVADA